MIISHKHKYLFLEIPHTGSTAISKELRANYAGVPILRKHAFYPEFLSVASPEEKAYTVIAGIRNPLDEAVTQFHKYQTNHDGIYTDKANLRANGGWLTPDNLVRFRFIQENDADFETYFMRFYTRTYTNVINMVGNALDVVIRFEHLQEDFGRALEHLGVEQIRPLPHTNPTSGRKRDFRSYYTPACYERAKQVFGPYMARWGYEFPRQWGLSAVPWTNKVSYRVQDVIKRFYWVNIKWGTTRYARALRSIWMRPG
jgi:hypothetical protein